MTRRPGYEPDIRPKTNNPKVLAEFDPEEITWLADRLHEEWERLIMAKAKAITTSPEKLAKIEEYQRMERSIRNRILKNADDQGFGSL